MLSIGFEQISIYDPEAYNVLNENNEIIAFVHVKNGFCTVRSLDDTILYMQKIFGDNCFNSETERNHHLKLITESIFDYYEDNKNE